tara:strand:- start:14430 stop:14921 length:492 start_codon:yes stop_codon:yes gene_type:complete
MALKGDRFEGVTDVSFFMDVASAAKGGIASLVTGGSGVALDQSNAKVSYAGTASGAIPIGLLLNDMVDIDQTRQHINFHKNEVQRGGKVTLLTQGWVVTSNYTGTPTAGAPAYLGADGEVTITQGAGGNASNAPVGRFLSSPDEDDYVKLEVHLPNVLGDGGV